MVEGPSFLYIESCLKHCYDGARVRNYGGWGLPWVMAQRDENDRGSIFKLEDRGDQLWRLVFDLPHEKVNKLNRRVMDEFSEMLSSLERMGKEGKIEALVLVSGKPGNFIAGADIEMIRAVQTIQEAENLSQAGQKLADGWEDLPFITVAAIEGAALGGGCELALASSAIVMSDDPAAKIGLPEVMLGIIPGMGGCIRLPRKVGVATALDMILTGKTLNAERAYRAGLIEQWLPKQDFENSVFRWVKANLKTLKAGQRIAKEPKLGGMGGPVGALMEKTSMGRNVIFKKAREGVLSKTKGQYPAPLEALAVVQVTGGSYGQKIRGSARDKAMAREAAGFGKVAVTDVSKNLIRLFFLTEGVKKSNGLPPQRTAAAHPIRNAAVLGAGVMGGGIAQLFAAKGIATRMKDLNTQALAAGIQAASRIFQKEQQKKKITKRQLLQKLNLIAPVLDYSGFGMVDAVVEAVVENMSVKQKVFQELEEHIKDDCIVATNTSSLSVTTMQSVMKKPERFVGMHFFNPVHRMPLIEVIRGEKTSDEAVVSIFQFSKALGKTPIVVKDAPGFLVNRLLLPYLNEATYCLAEGAPIPEIDQVLLDFGMPMGPLELLDEVGIDVAEKVAHILHDAFGDRAAPSELNAQALKAARLGRKNGKGYYAYNGRKKEFEFKIYDIIGIKPKPGVLSRSEILERCVLPMINEASRCLEEGIVSSAAEVDLGMIMGTGFPPFRGGLLRYADTIGPKNIVEQLRKYQVRFGARFEPAAALIARADKNEKFHAS